MNFNSQITESGNKLINQTPQNAQCNSTPIFLKEMNLLDC